MRRKQKLKLFYGLKVRTKFKEIFYCYKACYSNVNVLSNIPILNSINKNQNFEYINLLKFESRMH